jgi:hypothetical protein
MKLSTPVTLLQQSILYDTGPEIFKRSNMETAIVGLEVGTFEFDLSVTKDYSIYTLERKQPCPKKTPSQRRFLR